MDARELLINTINKSKGSASRLIGTPDKFRRSIIHRDEFRFGLTAYGALPIIGEVLELDTGGFLIVDISAHGASVFHVNGIKVLI